MEYLEQKLNEPDRHDYYQMQVAAETRKSYVKQPNQVKIEQMRLKFAKPEPIDESTFDADEDSRMMMSMILPAIYGTQYEMPKLP